MQLVGHRLDELPDHDGFVRRMAVHDQEDNAGSMNQQPFQELDEHLARDPFVDGHEPKIAPPAHRRDQVDPESSPRRRHDRRLSAGRPGRPRMSVRTDARLVGKPDIRLLFQGLPPDRRELGLQPMLDLLGVLLIGAPERTLRRQAHLAHKTADRRAAQRDAELTPDDLPNHNTRPQRELELVLTRVLLHDFVDPGQGPAVELARPASPFLGIEPSPAALTVANQPTVDRGPADSQDPNHIFRRFSVLDGHNPPRSEFRQLGMGESAGIGCFHTEKDSTFCDSCQYYYEKVNKGRHAEAIMEATRARELDPLSSSIHGGLGETLFMAGRFDEAIEDLKKTIIMDPSQYYPHWLLGGTYLGKSMMKEAIEEFKKAFELAGENPLIVWALSTNYYRIGARQEADKLFASLQEKAKHEFVPSYLFFVVYKARGELDQAFNWLEKACEDSTYLLAYAIIWPDDIYHVPYDQRSTELLKKVGLIKAPGG